MKSVGAAIASIPSCRKAASARDMVNAEVTNRTLGRLRERSSTRGRARARPPRTRRHYLCDLEQHPRIQARALESSSAGTSRLRLARPGKEQTGRLIEEDELARAAREKISVLSPH